MFSTPENLLVGISGALGLKECHFLNKNVCLRKCCVISQKWWMLELSNLCHCVQHPWKLTNRDYWSPRNKGKQLSKLTHVFRKCSGASQNTVKAGAFKPLSIVFSTTENFTSRDSWSSRNKGKSLSKLKHVFRKCFGVSQNTVNARAFKPFAIVFSTPENLLVWDFWSSRNERKPLPKLKHVFWENAVGVSQNTVNARAFKHLPLCSAPLKTY